MLRAVYCLFCGGAIPFQGRIDRKYCRPSCRTLAYRYRRDGRTSPYMLASENTESGDLLVLAQQLEERALETARQLAQVRVRIGARESSVRPVTSHGRGKQSPRSKKHQASAPSHGGSSAASPQKLEKQLRDAESRIEQQQQQIADLQHREAKLQQEATEAKQRAAQLEADLWQERSDERERRKPETRHPETGERTHSQSWPQTRAAGVPLEPEPAPERKQRQWIPSPSVEIHPKPYAARQRKASDDPAVMDIVSYVLHERLPALIAQQRPNLQGRVRTELADESSGLQIIGRAIARRLWALMQEDDPVLQNRSRLAKETIRELEEQIASKPGQQALAEPWFEKQRSILTLLVQEIAQALLARFPRSNKRQADTSSAKGKPAQRRGHRANEEDEPEEDDSDEEEDDDSDDD